jgi:hypothetical protein
MTLYHKAIVLQMKKNEQNPIPARLNLLPAPHSSRGAAESG